MHWIFIQPSKKMSTNLMSRLGMDYNDEKVIKNNNTSDEGMIN